MDFPDALVLFLEEYDFSFERNDSTFLISLNEDFCQDSFIVLVLFLTRVRYHSRDCVYLLSIIDDSSVEVSFISSD